MSILDKLNSLHPTEKDLLRQLAENARNATLDPKIRLRCAAVLGQIGTDLIMDDLQEQALKAREPQEPKYEYRFIRGARVKVRIN